jgi:hypothetical protein
VSNGVSLPAEEEKKMVKELFDRIQDMVTGAKLPPEVAIAVLQDVKDDGVLPMQDASTEVRLEMEVEISLIVGTRDVQWDSCSDLLSLRKEPSFRLRTYFSIVERPSDPNTGEQFRCWRLTHE